VPIAKKLFSVKIAEDLRDHMMPQLSDIRCKMLSVPALPRQAKGAINEWKNEGVYVGC